MPTFRRSKGSRACDVVSGYRTLLGDPNAMLPARLLERWLTHRPEPGLMTAWQTCLKGLCESLSPDERVILKQELLHATRTTAEAAGGFLGLGRISSAEQQVLDTLASSFCQ